MAAVTRRINWRRALLGALVAAAVLAVTAVALAAVVSVRVSGSSMRPTLYDGDRVIVDPFAGPPARLDVIAVRFDDDTPLVVKRVVAVAGDRVRVDGSTVLVHPSGAGGWLRVDNPAWRDQWRRVDAPVDVVVPDGAVFVVGDNPDASEDSRRLGAAPLRLARGAVRLRVYPLGSIGRPAAPDGGVTLRPTDPPVPHN